MKNLTILIAAIIILIGVTSEAKYSGGTGETNDPYRIATAADLNDIGNHEDDWDKHFILINDVNLAQYTGTQFRTIGYLIDYYHNKPFTGVFDGNDHKIWNFTWHSTDANSIGLFGFVDEPAQIKNLGLENVDVNVINGMYVGGLVGGNAYAGITNCYSTGSVSGNERVGGLVGENYGGTITNCYSTTSVSGTWLVGGLMGTNYGMMTDCHSASSVWGQWCIGGLVGSNAEWITNCYSTGSVSGNAVVGGLVGANSYIFARISFCYSSGSVSGNERVGGLVGSNIEAGIVNCYSSGSTSGNNCVGGLAGYNTGNEFAGVIANCYSTGRVSGTVLIGGLVGENYDTINKCYSTGSVNGTEYYVGGLVGLNAGGIKNCYSTGSVSGSDRVGGLVGQNGRIELVCDPEFGYWEQYYPCYIPCYIYNCYSTGKVMGSSEVGGLVGSRVEGEIRDSFWDTETSGWTTSSGGTPKTTVEMKTKSTFTSAGWDFVNIWDICEGTNYPRFIWQILVGDFTCPDGVDFVDFAVLASAWQSKPDEPNWWLACDISQPKDNFIDELDLAIFCENWLEERK
jgi:hypothetical protein